ncbi:hypothetical protein CMEL01_06710 [Colletotrichum melonis]|uniref:Uncharacterized protein n=1 Tax=Colletotrichum melonis TaxID=1209925 RepID=A0AAI9U5P5_9PEZI|nr:hypothetical protein CMEL01_06710 [Colletotrichum melonis]
MSIQRIRWIEMVREGKSYHIVRVLGHKYSQLRIGPREQLPSHQTQYHAPQFDKKWSCELETQIQLHQYNDKKRSHHWETSGRAGVSSVRLRLHVRVERGGYPGQPVGSGRRADECAYRLSVKWGTGGSLIAMTRSPVKSPRAHSFIGDPLHFPCAREQHRKMSTDGSGANKTQAQPRLVGGHGLLFVSEKRWFDCSTRFKKSVPANIRSPDLRFLPLYFYHFASSEAEIHQLFKA